MQRHSLLRLQQGHQLPLQQLLRQKKKATALTLSFWLPCHQRYRLRSWNSRGESGECEKGNASNNKRLLLLLPLLR